MRRLLEVHAANAPTLCAESHIQFGCKEFNTSRRPTPLEFHAIPRLLRRARRTDPTSGE